MVIIKMHYLHYSPRDKSSNGVFYRRDLGATKLITVMELAGLEGTSKIF